MANGLEKLRYLLDELVLAAELASYATDSDMARMLARHIAVRLPDVILLLRQLRKALPPTPGREALKVRLNKLEADFKECLQRTRDRLSAHLQDLGFVERQMLWLAIDSSQIGVLVQDVRELWDELGQLGAPDHQPFVTPAALASPAVASALAYLARDVNLPVTLGTDFLSFARANTTSMGNSTAIHARAGQLALLRRWIPAQHELYAMFRPEIKIARILKARILTDIVSFQDCLVTRPLDPGKPQEMDGLDKLIVAEGEVPRAISDFVAGNRDDATIEPLRRLRNRVGGHFDLEPLEPLAQLLAELDDFELESALRYYRRLEGAFLQTCREIPFLFPHLADGKVIDGVLVNAPDVASYDPARPDLPAGLPARPDYSEDALRAQLTRWLSGFGHERAETLRYFQDAFAHAPVIDRRIVAERFGSSLRNHFLDIRESHLLWRDALLASDRADEAALVELAMACPGHPSELAAMLVDHHQISGRAVTPALLAALGTLAPWWFEDARGIVEHVIATGDGCDRLQARTVLLRMYVLHDGLARMNRQASHVTWAEIRARIEADVPPVEDIATALALAGVFLERDTRAYVWKFDAEYRELADRVVAVARRRLGGTLDQAHDNALHALVYRGWLAQAVLLIANTGMPGHEAGAKRAMLHAFDARLIACGETDEEGVAAAECLLKFGADQAALATLERVAQRRPNYVEPQLRLIECLAADATMAGFCQDRVTQLREQFKLDAAQRARLDAVAAKLGMT